MCLLNSSECVELLLVVASLQIFDFDWQTAAAAEEEELGPLVEFQLKQPMSSSGEVLSRCMFDLPCLALYCQCLRFKFQPITAVNESMVNTSCFQRSSERQKNAASKSKDALCALCVLSVPL